MAVQAERGPTSITVGMLAEGGGNIQPWVGMVDAITDSLYPAWREDWPWGEGLNFASALNAVVVDASEALSVTEAELRDWQTELESVKDPGIRDALRVTHDTYRQRRDEILSWPKDEFEAQLVIRATKSALESSQLHRDLYNRVTSSVSTGRAM